MTNSAVRKAVSKKLTIDVAIAEASAPVEYTFSCQLDKKNTYNYYF